MLILHSYWTPQFQNFTIPPIWLSSHSRVQTCRCPCITFSLNNWNHLPIYYLEFLGLVISLFFFFWGGNYVSIKVNIISNKTVLQCYLLWIFESIKSIFQLIVCIFPCTRPSHFPKNQIFQWTPIILKFFIINAIPSFTSN